MRVVTVVGSKKGGRTAVGSTLVRQPKASEFKVATVRLMEKARSVDNYDTETDLTGPGTSSSIE